MDALARAFSTQFQRTPSVTIGFLGDDIIVGRMKLKNTSALASLSRHFRERHVEKLTFSTDMGKEGLRTVVGVLADRDPRRSQERLAGINMKGCAFGLIATETAPPADLGLEAARQVYALAVRTAEAFWGAAGAGTEPDPDAARVIIDALASAVAQDRTSMIALTSLKTHDSYTFSHMVNVSLLTMAQARTLGIQGSLLREFGVAGLVHDIGKVKTPPELLNKPGRLSDPEMRIVKRHVVDGAQILRRTPDMPALAPVVAFEHHLRQDLSGYPEGIGHRYLNLCTMLVSIADVFDALRTNRAYRQGLPSDRVRAMLAAQSGTAFEPTLLRRFITLMGLFPIGTVVRLQSGEVGVVTAEHATDPFRPQVRLGLDASGTRLRVPTLVNTWERDERGNHPYSVLEAVEPGTVGIDPLALMAS